jgi:hypothetical protein
MLQTKFFYRFIYLLFLPFLAPAQILNGDFQTPAIPNNGCNAGANWTLLSPDEPQYVITGSNAWVDLTTCQSFGNGTGIEQTFNLIPGRTYNIQMDLASCCGWQVWDTGVDLYIDGVPLNVGTNRLYNDSFDCDPDGSGYLWLTVLSNTFTASNNPATLRIIGNGANPQVPSYPSPNAPGVMGLDNIKLNDVTNVTALFEQQGNSRFLISPNPASDVISIALDSEKDEIKKIEIFSLTGELLQSANGFVRNLNVGDLKDGSYILKIRTSQQSKVQRLVIIK